MNETTPVTRWIQDVPVPAALISYAYRATQRKFAKALSDHRIGWGHFAILMTLYEKDGRSQDELALSRGFDKTMIAKSVKRLEEEELIYRITDRYDRRIKRLYLTETGRRLCPEFQEIGLEINTSLLKGFTEDESRRLLDYLRRLALNASKM